jgi:hypothetical protein
MLFLIRENSQNINGAGVEESRLIVSILAMIVHKVPAEDLVRRLEVDLLTSSGPPMGLGRFIWLC